MPVNHSHLKSNKRPHLRGQKYLLLVGNAGKIRFRRILRDVSLSRHTFDAEGIPSGRAFAFRRALPSVAFLPLCATRADHVHICRLCGFLRHARNDRREDESNCEEVSHFSLFSKRRAECDTVSKWTNRAAQKPLCGAKKMAVNFWYFTGKMQGLQGLPHVTDTARPTLRSRPRFTASPGKARAYLSSQSRSVSWTSIPLWLLDRHLTRGDVSSRAGIIRAWALASGASGEGDTASPPTPTHYTIRDGKPYLFAIFTLS